MDMTLYAADDRLITTKSSYSKQQRKQQYLRTLQISEFARAIFVLFRPQDSCSEWQNIENTSA